MKHEMPILDEDQWANDPDVDFDDDFEVDELELDEEWPLVEDVRRLAELQ